MTPEHLILIGSGLAVLAVLASKVSERFGLPTLLLFLGIGMLAGSEGPGKIFFEDFETAKFIGTAALAIILFYGGLDTRWELIKPVVKEGVFISTAGVFITAMVLGTGIHIILKLPILHSLLLGSMISSTDAAMVFSILRSKGISLKGRLKPILEFDAASNDPMAVFLTVGILSLITNESSGVSGMILGLILQMGIGFLAGFAGGKLIVIIVNRINLYYEGLYPILVAACVFLLFSLVTLFKGSGFLAVYIAGIIVSNSRLIHKKNIVRFNESIAWVMQIMMFIVLGLLVYPSHLPPVAMQGIVTAMILIFIARPVNVFISLSMSGYTFREKLLVSWVGLLGAVPIILATFPLAAGMQGGEAMFNIVFFVVLISAILQGSTVALAAKVLGLNEPLQESKRYPLEFEQTAGLDADLNEVFIPFGSDVAGKRVFELGVPQGAVITMISRGDKFIIPNGTTVIEEGDVMLVMAEKGLLKEVEKRVAMQKPQEEEKEEGKN